MVNFAGLGGYFSRPPPSSVHIFDTLENVIFNLDHSFLIHPLLTHPMHSHLTNNLSLMQVVGSNTHIGPDGSESLIDLVLMPSPRALTKCCVTPALGNSLWNLSHTEELTPSSTCMVKQEQNHSCTINDDESKAQLLNEYFVKNLTIPESQMDS